jgi:hypothetical protein
MFATFVIEAGHDPLKLEQLPAALQSWLLAVGGFAAVGIVIGLALYAARGLERRGGVGDWNWGVRIPLILLGGLGLMLLPSLLRVVWNLLGWFDPTLPTVGKAAWYEPFQQYFKNTPLTLLLDYGAACAVVAVLLPVLANVTRLRWRRVWALARLSVKEAVRRRALWGFSLLLLLFLFGSWFLPYKPEDQVRNYVRAVYWVMTPLLLAIAGLLVAFSLPTDIRQQTIHTIVTKPVERFEIVLGRFLGYAFLMSAVLGVMTLFSLIYVARGIDQEAAEESLKARVPIYGNLIVTNPKNVGYEWDYRQYISGAVKDEEAIWTFPTLPRHLAERPDTVRCEFTFDIFRTTKGEENKGVFCTFVFENADWDPRRVDEYRQDQDLLGRSESEVRRRAEQDKWPEEKTKAVLAERERLEQLEAEVRRRAAEENWPEEKTRAVLSNPWAEKYGYYELPSKEVVDYHTLYVDVPAGLFRSLEKADPAKSGRPPLRVTVRCESATQYLGVAKYDLYLLDAERSFAVNFFKGAIGLVFRMCLLIGLVGVASTYLSGVISYLVGVFIFTLGLFPDFIKLVAEGKSMGGGPMENAVRLGTGTHVALPLEGSPVATLAKNVDKGFEAGMRVILQVIPNVDRFDFTDYVGEGFNISWVHLLMTGLALVAYLLPWLILAYYLMRSREIATW